MADLYLTIDDSPSDNFTVMCDYLKAKNIPAVLFSRGDLLSLYPQETIKAIQDGFIVANHSWSHHRASKLGADIAVKEVMKTQRLIEKYHKEAGVALPGPYMRFPYMDSGLGGWPLPASAFTETQQETVMDVYGKFYGIGGMDIPDQAAIERNAEIEEVLRAEGFRQIEFPDIQVDWYNTYAASSVVSTQGTFCHPDWYRYKRYAAAFPEEERSVARLNKNFDDYITQNAGAHIIVMHDKSEMWADTKAMIDHMVQGGHNFLPIPV